jgi:hypothetical protein
VSLYIVLIFSRRVCKNEREWGDCLLAVGYAHRLARAIEANDNDGKLVLPVKYSNENGADYELKVLQTWSGIRGGP